MSEFKGTTGPWKIINERDDTYFPSVVFSDTDDTGWGISKIVVNESHDKKMGSIRANAKLISKAPEMLHALEYIINETNFQSHFPTTAIQIKQLIKSATQI